MRALIRISAAIGLALSGAIVSAAERVEVDRIEITGVRLLDRTEVEAALELTAGDVFERVRVIKSAENLQEAYRLRGYESVRIQTQLLRTPVSRAGRAKPRSEFETVLHFTVTEGDPTHVAEVEVIPVGIAPGSPLDRYWQRSRSRLLGTISLQAGSVLQQDRVATSRRALQDALASDEFIGAKVLDVKAVPIEARRVRLEFRVELGDRVKFGFRGNHALSRSELAAMIEELRQRGLGKDYIPLIRERIEQAYAALGYARARISTQTYEEAKTQERLVRFHIQEGARTLWASIRFDGQVEFSNETLLREFMARASEGIQKGIYVEKEVEAGAERVAEWMRSQGYQSSRIVTVHHEFDGKGRVNLVIYLFEGVQTRVRRIDVSGSEVASPEEIRSQLGIAEGQPFDPFALSHGIEVLKRSFAEQGYLHYAILNEAQDADPQLVTYLDDNRLVDISLQIREGRQYKVSRIEVEGLQGTREHIVVRELELRPGDVIRDSLVTRSEQKLRRLGIFSSAAIRLADDPDEPGSKVVRVLVAEGTPGLYGGGIGFRNDLGIRVFGQVGYSNLWKENHQLGLTASVNHRILNSFCATNACFLEYQTSLAYTWPWFAGDEITFRPRVSVDNIRYRLFDAATLSLGAAFERRIFKSPLVVAAFAYNLERTIQSNSANVEDNQTLVLGYVMPSIRVDTRDNALAPTRGFFAQASFEYAAPWLGSRGYPPTGDQFPVSYTRFQTRSDLFVPIGSSVVWYLSFRSGYALNLATPPASDPNNANYAIPLVKQFALGGVGSLRGFGEQELTAQSTAIRGTLTYVNYRTQLDLPFSGAMKFGPFLDAANLNVDSFSFGDLKYGAGIGFHYQSPIGPVNFDWGFRLRPPPTPTQDVQQFYFSIGVI